MPQRTIVTSFPQTPFPESEEKGFFVNTKRTALQNQAVFSIGAPHLRTVWGIQNVVLKFELEIKSHIVSETKQQLVLTTLAGNVPVSVNRLEFTLPKRISEIEPSITLIPEKEYILELFSPINLSRGEDLAIEIFTPALLNSIVFKFLKPQVLVNLEQNAPSDRS